MSGRKSAQLEFEGLEIDVFRDEDGVLNIQIDTSELEGDDVFPPHDVPRLRVHVNEEVNSTVASGGWVTHP